MSSYIKSQQQSFGAGDECVICLSQVANGCLHPCNHYICHQCVALPRLRLTSFDISACRAKCPTCSRTVVRTSRIESRTLNELKRKEETAANREKLKKAKKESKAEVELREKLARHLAEGPPGLNTTKKPIQRYR